MAEPVLRLSTDPVVRLVDALRYGHEWVAHKELVRTYATPLYGPTMVWTVLTALVEVGFLEYESRADDWYYRRAVHEPA